MLSEMYLEDAIAKSTSHDIFLKVLNGIERGLCNVYFKEMNPFEKPSIKYVRKIWPTFYPPPPFPPCTQCVRSGLDPLPLYARTQFEFMYTRYNKHNIELVNRSPKLLFYANMPIFNYNIKLLNINTFDEYLKNA